MNRGVSHDDNCADGDTDGEVHANTNHVLLLEPRKGSAADTRCAREPARRIGTERLFPRAAYLFVHPLRGVSHLAIHVTPAHGPGLSSRPGSLCWRWLASSNWKARTRGMPKSKAKAEKADPAPAKPVAEAPAEEEDLTEVEGLEDRGFPVKKSSRSDLPGRRCF